MAIERNVVVALEFGSSKVRGIAGSKNLDGSIQILAMEEMNAQNCIRKGMVYNIDKTVMCLKNIVEKMEQTLGMHITQVFVGLGGQALKSKKNVVSKQLDAKTIVTQEMVDELLTANLASVNNDYEILEVVPQEYKVGMDSVTDPVGILSDSIEGVFLNIMIKAEAKEYIYKCFEAVGLRVAGAFVAPKVLSESVLTDTEKRMGCTLVDFGFGTTTVVVYKNNILRHVAVIPLGGNNVTVDICGLQIEEEDAENLKLKHASAYSERKADELEKNLLVNNARTIEEKLLLEIVEAREEEILNNVMNQICISGYQDSLLTGVIASGGASNIKDLDKAINERIRPEKIRFAKSITSPIHKNGAELVVMDGSLNVLLSILCEGNMNCLEPFPQELFEPQSEEQDETPVEEEVQEEKKDEVIEQVVEDATQEPEEEPVDEKPQPQKPKKDNALKRFFKKVLDTVSEE